MADNYERAKDEILKRTAGNGGPSNTDILIAMSALAQDGDDQHQESITESKAIRSLLGAHCEEAGVRDDRIAKLEHWKDDQSKHCVERVKQLIADEHRMVHAAHMDADHRAPRRRGDEKDTDFSGDRRVWLMWTVGSRVTNILVAAITALIVMGLSYLFFGAP
jgi:hypothetical protein